MTGRAYDAAATARRLAHASRIRMDVTWCPEEYRDEFLRLANRSDFTVTEARRIIEDHIAAMKRRASSPRPGDMLTSTGMQATSAGD